MMYKVQKESMWIIPQQIAILPKEVFFKSHQIKKHQYRDKIIKKTQIRSMKFKSITRI